MAFPFKEVSCATVASRVSYIILEGDATNIGEVGIRCCGTGGGAGVGRREDLPTCNTFAAVCVKGVVDTVVRLGVLNTGNTVFERIHRDGAAAGDVRAEAPPEIVIEAAGDVRAEAVGVVTGVGGGGGGGAGSGGGGAADCVCVCASVCSLHHAIVSP